MCLYVCICVYRTSTWTCQGLSLDVCVSVHVTGNMPMYVSGLVCLYVPGLSLPLWANHQAGKELEGLDTATKRIFKMPVEEKAEKAEGTKEKSDTREDADEPNAKRQKA